MTNIPEEQEREAFEHWLARRDDFEPEYLYRRNFAGSARIGEYSNSSVEFGWLAWQARAVAERQDSQALPEQPSGAPTEDTQSAHWVTLGGFFQRFNGEDHACLPLPAWRALMMLWRTFATPSPTQAAEARKPSETKVLLEHSGCGGNPQWEQVSVKLNPGDKVILVKGAITLAIEAAHGIGSQP